MKCIRCWHDSKYPERKGRRCPRCHGQFAFEPRENDLLTDGAFLSAIKRVSADGRIQWGVEHLYYEICRYQNRRSRHRLAYVLFFAAVGLVALGLSALTRSPGWVCLGAFMGAAALISFFFFWLPRRAAVNHVPVTLGRFDQMWQRWLRVHDRPAGLITRPEPPPTAAHPREPDVGDYSFDRAVICDRARTVDLLLANNFHFENNCAVLSVDGYPAGPFETVRTMLKRNPRLRVFALHDATVAGCVLAGRLVSEPDWFQSQVRVVDVGLRPAHARHFDGLLVDPPPPPAGMLALAEGAIHPDERAWLALHALELAAIRPEQVIKRLFRAMTRDDDGGGGGGDGDTWIVYDDVSFSGGAGASDGGGDSFG
jgi:DNA-directed RNA polymerase subunit RPC12/RpoP